MSQILVCAKNLNLLNSLDIYFAHMIYSLTKDIAIMLASACLSFNSNLGHTCLPIKYLQYKYLFNGKNLYLSKLAFIAAGKPSLQKWKKIFLHSNAVGNGYCTKPLVMEFNCLYLHRIWMYEKTVALFFSKNIEYTIFKRLKIINYLKKYFPNQSNNKNINYQKIAVTISMISNISIISGGPGTGKTFLISRILSILIKLNNNLNIKIATTTGKSASHLTQFLNEEKDNLKFSKKQKLKLPNKVVTLHRLLGAKKNNLNMFYNNKNKLNLDVLIIDEASMINLFIMYAIILALPKNAKLILIGDAYQLPSIETGSVLNDICKLHKIGYSKERQIELTKLTNFNLLKKKIKNNYHHHISDNICFLKKNYRFFSKSKILNLSNKINKGKINDVLYLLKNKKFSNIKYYQLSSKDDYKKMIFNCVNNYKLYFTLIINKSNKFDIIKSFSNVRILCALREGSFGVSKLNYYIKIALIKLKILDIKSNDKIYVGQPIILLYSAPHLQLYNGDIGIFLYDDNKQIKAHFLKFNKIKIVNINLLPEYETAFAITIHKSQGSEFKKVSIVFPNTFMPILTRELFYTAVTRAKLNVSIYSNDSILKQIVSNKSKRFSCLAKKINIYTKKI